MNRPNLRRKRGVAIFAKDFSGHPARKNQQKCTRPLMPSAAPIRPRHLVSTQPNKGSRHRLQNTLVEQIEKECAAVDACKTLVALFEAKIKTKIAEVWGVANQGLDS